MFSIPDVIPLIINNLDIPNISSFRQVCKEANNNFSWSNYFLSKTNIPDAYKEHNIDEVFMKEQGKYLMNIKDENVVKQWFKYYPYVCLILSEYYKFTGDQRYYFAVRIKCWDGEHIIIYNKNVSRGLNCKKMYNKLLTLKIMGLKLIIDYNLIFEV